MNFPKFLPLAPPLQAAIFLTIVYSVGVAGVAFAIHPDFLLLTPFNLLLSLAIVLWFHPARDLKLATALAIAFVGGYAVEVAGVHTGRIFGEYQYGRVLGIKVAAVPLMIGVNWAMLVYCAGVLANSIWGRAHLLARAALGATAMVALDRLIEPVAMRYDFWQWAGDMVPLQNYVAWWVVAFILLVAFHRLTSPSLRNPLALWLFALQALFFALLNVL